MFSVMNTGICRRPSWTAIVSPTMSGMIIEGRDHVLMITFCCDRAAAATRFANFG
jgi:hypothetical protein